MGIIILGIIIIAVIIGFKKNRNTKKAKTENISEQISPKSRLVALLLCLFLNPISAQRFYAKGIGILRIWWSIIKFCLFGLLCIPFFDSGNLNNFFDDDESIIILTIILATWGLGTLLDLIKILNGTFKDKEGKYIRNWTTSNVRINWMDCIIYCVGFICSFIPFVISVFDSIKMKKIPKRSSNVAVLCRVNRIIKRLIIIYILGIVISIVIGTFLPIAGFFTNAAFGIFAAWSFIQIHSVKKSVIEIYIRLSTEKDVNITEVYGVDAKLANSILMQGESISKITIPSQQLVLAIALPMVKDYKLVVFKKWNSLYLINAELIFAQADSTLSEEQRKTIIERLNYNYGTYKLDALDWAISAVSGVICGLIDVFFVGKPGESKLQDWTDKSTDKMVMNIAKLLGWEPSEKQKENPASAIGFLERKFPVPYDARYDKDLGITNEANSTGMSSSNHHLKSLAHSPDFVGLFFSLVDQFSTDESGIKHTTIISNSHIEMYSYGTTDFELKGKNIVSKLFCGIANWIGHILSDIAGSSGSQERGSGVSGPYYELLQFANFGSVTEERKTIAELSIKLFENGYDARFMAAASIPVLLNEYIIKLSWILKQHFYHKIDWKDIRVVQTLIPENTGKIIFKENPEMQKMLLAGYGTFCGVDFGGALISSNGKFDIEFFLHINLPAWKKLATEGFLAAKSGLRKMCTNPARIEQEIQQMIEKES